MFDDDDDPWFDDGRVIVQLQLFEGYEDPKVFTSSVVLYPKYFVDVPVDPKYL